MRSAGWSRARTVVVALMALVVFATITPSLSSAPKPGWTFLGRTQASHTKDHDVIKVNGPADNFKAIKFQVTDAPLNLRRLVVTYDNNTKENLDVRENIPQGGESRPIDLRGGKRSLRRVEFWYDTKGMGRGKADVSLFGRH